MGINDLYLVLIPLLCVVAIFGLLYMRLTERKRTKVFEEFALRMGFSFSPKDDHGLLNKLGESFLYWTGYSGRRIYNLLQATMDSLEVAMFDFNYWNGSGRHSGVNPTDCTKCDRVLDGIFTLDREKGSCHEIQKVHSRF